MLEKIQQTTSFLKNKIKQTPDFAIILGSGLGNLVETITDSISIPYKEIPNFPISTVEGHAGELIFGNLSGKYVLAMKGRFHFYEGYSMQQVTFPIRVMSMLGIKNLIVSNAAGGINPQFRTGSIMMITDHINLFPEHPLRGKNMDFFGPRFPDMSCAYDLEFRKIALQIAKENQITLHQGVYVGNQGPTFETPAEYRYFHTIGGDAVGMSTVPEVIVANHCGMRVFALSVITNEGLSDQINSHEEVQENANLTQPNMTTIIKGVIKRGN